MTRWLALCAMIAAACGSKPDRATRIDRALRTLCGDRYRATIERRSYEHGTISGCRTDGDAPGVEAWFESLSDGKWLRVFLDGDEASMPGHIASVTSALAPLLDAVQRAVVAEELPMLVPDRFRPYARVVNDVAISAATWTGDDDPWHRHAMLTVRFDVPTDEEERPPMATALETMGEQFGWSHDLGLLDATMLATWRAACADGEWATGDVWARCRSAESTFWAEWAPPTRRLLRVYVEARADLAGVVEPLVMPLLTDEQRATVRDGLTDEVDSFSELADVYVRSQHGPDRHSITIATESR